MKIDAHQHFWEFDPVDYPWINDHMRVLKQSFLPDHLAAEQAKSGFVGSVTVQARQTLEETRWLLDLAAANDRILGVVGWVDLRSPDVKSQLARFASHQKFCGVRHVVQDEPDDRFMLAPDFLRGIEALAEFQIAYDFLTFPRQLPAAIAVAKKFPEQRFVLDHLSKPDIAKGSRQPWKDHVRELASLPNVYCKVSGMVTEADWNEWRPEQMIPYLDVVSDAFGPSRLMVGSDWPVCLLAADYASVINIPDRYFSSRSEENQNAIFGKNAARFYNLTFPPR